VIRQVKADHCVKLKQMPAVLQRLVSKNGIRDLPEVTSGDCEGADENEPVTSKNEPFALTCPECDGAMLPVKDGKLKQWHCHLGHRFTLSSFTEAHADAVERAVWVALRKLRERQVINDQLSHDSANSPHVRKRFGENAAAAAYDIKLLEEVLARL
jgi:two-component system chemotaxis response regulator CheB